MPRNNTRLRSLAFATILITSMAPAAAQRASGKLPEASVRAHMEFLASDAMNGRGSGTRDEWIAATYVAAQMRKAGVEPLGDGGGYVQTVDIERFELTSTPVVVAGSARLTHGKEALVRTLAAPGVSAPLRKYRVGEALPKGAAVLLPDPAPEEAFSAVLSAEPALVLSPETEQTRARWAALGARLPVPAPRIAGIASSGSRQPSAIVLDKASYAAVGALAEETVIRVEAEAKPSGTRHTWNAVGKLTGRDPRRAPEVILLSAHIDHIGNSADRPGATPPPSGDTINNGADDDASGSIAVLELMSALAKGKRPRRTVVFALFGSEESGGLGSAFFADKPVVPLPSIVANLQFEMIGRPDPKVPPNTLWLTGYDRSTLGPRLAREGAKLVLDPHPEMNFFERSDNIQFARRGVVAHTVSSYGLHEDYHRPSDDVKSIDFIHMAEAIASMIDPIRWLANTTFRPEWLPGKKP